ncbi:hypothetical protein QBC37DRAFT_425467 [Rhypophila decipiens]|uniref:Tat pathway signal sequence protein n=1 Tax=Rhypophila decipiens TaxID=261697 RepID=A0AAN6Y693_9PEZI|nr:hypothetical protein QBC37DRAFT_425467 [Rhypophila decipiens]
MSDHMLLLKDSKHCPVCQDALHWQPEVGEDKNARHRRKYNILSVYYLILLHLICLSLLGWLFLLGKFNAGMSSRQGLEMLDFDNRYKDWVPVTYELRAENALENPPSDFMGMPNEKNTKAWDELITPTYFAASRQDLQKTKESINDSVLLGHPHNGEYYLAGLGVYHDIHCLRRLRLFLHSNYYYDRLTDVNLQYLREHLGHCIESLRRSVMCSADTNIFTFTWEDAEEVHPGIFRPNPKSNQQRKCVRWELVEKWVTDRHVPLSPVLLKPDGRQDKIMMV